MWRRTYQKLSEIRSRPYTTTKHHETFSCNFWGSCSILIVLYFRNFYLRRCIRYRKVLHSFIFRRNNVDRKSRVGYYHFRVNLYRLSLYFVFLFYLLCSLFLALCLSLPCPFLFRHFSHTPSVSSIYIVLWFSLLIRDT